MSGPAAVLLLSAPAYAVLFAVSIRNSLPALTAGVVPPDLGYSAASSPTLQLLNTVCLLYLFAVYGVALWRWRGWRVSRRTLAWSVAAATLMAWTLMPADSSDILEYIGFGRIVAVHHADPYAHKYSEYTDSFSSYVTWDEAMPYGPVAIPLFAAAGVVSERSVIAAIYLMKFFWALVHLLNAWLVYRLARRLTRAPDRAVFLFAFNPLILVEQAGNGHNDGLLILFGLAAIWALEHRREALAIALAFGGALVKTPGAFCLAAVVVVAVRRRRWRELAWGLSLVALIVGVVSVVLPRCWGVLTVMDAQWQYAEDSLHTLVIEAAGAIGRSLGRQWAYDDLFGVDRLLASVVFVVVAVRRLLAVRDTPTLVTETGAVLTLLVIGFAVSVYPWYVTWLLPAAALTESQRLRRTIGAAAAASLALYAFPFALVEVGPHHALWSAGRLSIAFGVPIAVWTMTGRLGMSLTRPWRAPTGPPLAWESAPGLPE